MLARSKAGMLRVGAWPVSEGIAMNRWIRGLMILTLAGVASLARAEAPFSFADTPGTLPKDVLPVDYVLHVVPNIASRTFQGSQMIRIEVRRATSKIVMNALNIEIDSATLAGRGLARTRLDAPQIDKERQMLTFTLAKPLAPGRYTLAMSWRGLINSAPEGLYADPYPTPAGERLLIATMMEPTRARRLLPCWDEPSFRARFRLSIDLPSGFTAYSNMPVIRTEKLAGGLQRVAFATTPKMPSYLLALVAGDMQRLDGAIDGTRIGIVTTAGKRGSAGYALDASKQLLRYYNGYFGTRYPLPKLDQIGMPGGFYGAMENWGAIVYNETTLLVDPRGSPESTRQAVFGTIAHEMAHQWFGNLVTMAWWDNLWLNEGFAQWMGTKASDRFNPQWHVWLWANEGREWAMNLDARNSTHPIQQPVADDSQATDAFDRITYQKGSGFLRMLESYLGEARFRDGIRAYLERHRYSNTTTADLWAALAKASGKPVAKIASDWTTQPGFPLIEVDARCVAGQRHIALRQEQFRLGSDEPPGERLWSVPLQIGSVGAADGGYTLLQARTATLVRSGCDAPLLVDADNVGFYRVRYAPPLFDALAALWPRLSDSARFRLLADTSALVQADRTSLTSYFGLLRRLGAEPRLALWQRVLADLELFDQLSLDEPSRTSLHSFAVRLIRPRFVQLGFDERPGESVEDRQLRGTLARALSWYGDAAVIAEGRARFARFVADPSSLPPSLIDSVLHIAGRHADQATFDTLERLAERALTSEEKFRYYRALADALDGALATQALQLSRGAAVPQIIRNEIVADVARSGHLEAAWAFARRQADALLADMALGAGNRYFGGVVETSASARLADELEAFVGARLPEGALVNARRTGDEIRTRAKLKSRLLSQLEEALAGEQLPLRR
jgi:aminopeptidase N